VSSVIKRDSVQLSAAGEHAPARSTRPVEKDDGLTVRLLRVDGDVRAIQVGCPCGRQHVLELQYEAASVNQAAKA
jgi:hypothetical protein